MKLKKFFPSAVLITGAVLALSPFVLSPVCGELRPDGTHMNCFYSGIFITSMGVLTVIFSLFALKRKFPLITAVLSVSCAVLSWFVPNGIITLAGNTWAFSLCADMTHSCRAVMIPAVGVISMIIVILCVASLAVSFVKGDE